MAATLYPELIPDIEKINWLLRNCIQDQTHYSRVVGPVGEPQGAILTHTGNNEWAMKKHAKIILWYSDIPGAGAALLRGFRDWVKGQAKTIVLAGFDADWVVEDVRTLALAERIGFRCRGAGGYFFFPRGAKA